MGDGVCCGGEAGGGVVVATVCAFSASLASHGDSCPVHGLFEKARALPFFVVLFFGMIVAQKQSGGVEVARRDPRSGKSVSRLTPLPLRSGEMYVRAALPHRTQCCHVPMVASPSS